MVGALGDFRFTRHKSEINISFKGKFAFVIKISVKGKFAFVAAHKRREAMVTLPSLKWIGRIKKTDKMI